MASSSTVQWEIEIFELRTSTIDQRNDVLYANGQMQVPVIALIIAIDPKTASYHLLTESELASIKLVDYHDPSKGLPPSWSYSSLENEFDHTIPLRNTVKLARPSSAHITYQQKRYWVTTTAPNTQQIAATIQQPNQETVTSDRNIRITLEGLFPIQYSLDDFYIDEEYVIPVDDSNEGIRGQKNFYISSKGHTLQTNRLIGHHPGDGGDGAMKYCFYIHSSRNRQEYLYFWPMGPERDRMVGKTDEGDATIRTNQQTNSMCLTSFHSGPTNRDVDYRSWSGEFILTDRFGDQVRFYVKPGRTMWTLQIDPYEG